MTTIQNHNNKGYLMTTNQKMTKCEIKKYVTTKITYV